MAKLTKKDQKRLTGILYDLKRGQAYIMRPDTHVCRECRRQNNAEPMTIEFSRKSDDVVLQSMCKEIGSDLAILWTGIRDLQNFLEAQL